MSEAMGLDRNVLRQVIESVVDRMLVAMDTYVKRMEFTHIRLLSQMAKKEGKHVPYGLAHSLTHLTWMARDAERKGNRGWADHLWSLIAEISEPYADMWQEGLATERDVFMGEPHEDRIKVLSADDVVDDIMKNLEMKQQEGGATADSNSSAQATTP